MKKQKITAKAMSLFLAFLLAAGLTACVFQYISEDESGNIIFTDR